jgi:ABC-type Zn uptake system ZnuABC Zn-binding protein ZnuA/ABC-type Mn2+/Zn2+ transport system permease subunit
MDSIVSPFELSFVQRGLFEVLLLSVGAGLLGTWIVLRGLAFFSHAVGTAAFPGLVLADGLGFAAPLGALGAALVFAVALARLGRRRRTGYDSLTALVLAGALALGVILASDVFHSDANVESLLFGSLLLIEPRDLVIAGAASALALVATASLGRAWLVAGFDPPGARALGLRSALPEQLLLALIALTVIASVSAVGALLVTALIVTPAATVRVWNLRLSAWRTGAVTLTGLEGTVGLWLSVKLNAPPGATIAVLSGALFALSATARAITQAGAPRAATVATAALLALGLASCGNSGSGGGSGKVDVVATTTQIGDWARQVGGDAADVHQILKPSSDPHEYELRPADVEAAAGADLVFKNGDNLDAWAGKLVDEAGGDPEVVDLSKYVIDPLPGADGGTDPHWWHDPRNAEKAVSAIRDALVRAAPQSRETFEHNARTYLAKLRRLDLSIAACVRLIPRSARKLVTDHDALGYFANRYGLQIVGAVIPSQTTEAQPSAGELGDLVHLIEREHVRAVFPEANVNKKLAEAIARQTGAFVKYELYSDTLGPSGSDGTTYVGMEATNAERIFRGLTGGKRGCHPFGSNSSNYPTHPPG